MKNKKIKRVSKSEFLNNSEFDLFGCLVEDCFLCISELQLEFFIGSFVVHFHVLTQKIQCSQRWTMTALLDTLGVNRIVGDFVSLWSVILSQNFEDFMSFDLGA